MKAATLVTVAIMRNSAILDWDGCDDVGGTTWLQCAMYLDTGNLIPFFGVD